MKEFFAKTLHLFILAFLVVIINNLSYAGGINISSFGDNYIQEIHNSDYPTFLYFEPVDLNYNSGIPKPNLSHHAYGNSCLQSIAATYKNLYFKNIPPSCRDIQYTLNLQIFPSHYFW